MKFKISVLVLSILGAFGSVAAEDTPFEQRSLEQRIIGGNKSAVDAWPFMTALVKKGYHAFSSHCGASFIGDRYVLTAAHCVDKYNPEELDVIIGIHDRMKESSQGQRVGIKNIYIHEQFDRSTLNNDISVIELERTVLATPVTLADSHITLNAGDSTTVMGWGDQESDPDSKGIYPNELYEVSVPLVSKQVCQASGVGYSHIDDSTLCAGYVDGGKDACWGDSGGPLIFNNNGITTQIGVVSWGDGCAQPKKYGVYAKVANLKSWVEKKQTNGVSYRQYVRFGHVSVGNKLSKVLTITNNGSSAFKITNTEISENSSIRVVSNQCENAGTLYSEQSCNITVEVTPQLGANSVTLKAYTNNADYPVLSTIFHTDGLSAADTNLQNMIGLSTPAYGNANPWEVANFDTEIIKAGETPLGQKSVLKLENLKAGKISFETKPVISDSKSNFEVYLNRKLVLYSNEIEDSFTNYEFDLTSENNDIEFIYKRYRYSSLGSDTVYIRNINYTNAVVSDTTDTDNTSSSGGSLSFGWLLLLLPFAIFRNRRTHQ